MTLVIILLNFSVNVYVKIIFLIKNTQNMGNDLTIPQYLAENYYLLRLISSSRSVSDDSDDT